MMYVNNDGKDESALMHFPKKKKKKMKKKEDYATSWLLIQK